MMRRIILARCLLGASLALAGACASMGGATSSGTEGSTAAMPAEQWPTYAREHVDLWLHGYALLTRDTATVPFFQRGYRERMGALKSQRNVFTQLDANRERLSARFTANPGLVNGQFVPLYFASWSELQEAVSLFLQAQGDPRATNDPTLRAYFALLAGTFQTGADRDWLRLFTQSLDDERTRWYRDYWESEQRTRAGVRTAVDSLWQRVYRPRLQRFLNNTQQESGELILSLPLDGEGRTVTLGQRRNAMAVTYPETPATAVEAIYVVAHESVGSITNTAILDNTTPAQQRAGETSAYAGTAPVRAGALLLARVAPDLVPGYMRYYLRSANRTAPTGDPTAAFESAFALPNTIRDAIIRQIDVVLGGI